MAYATKYQFEFKSVHGATGKVLIEQDGFSGEAISRALGRAPVLRKESGNNGIYGTSLELYAECIMDGEFADLYTSDAQEFRVTLQRGGSTIWRGFVTPELYADPDIAPPYDVQITATDGLGELKNYDFTDFTTRSVAQHIVNILGYTGLTVSASDLILVSSLICYTPSILSLLNAFINPAHMKGKSCYEVLANILETFHLSITQHNGTWLLVRLTDVVRTGSTVAAETGSGTSTTLPVASFGSMASYDWWPIGYLQRQVVPAKNRVTMDLPFQFRTMLTNPEFNDGFPGWSYSGASFAPSTYGVNKPVLAYDGGYIAQSLQVAADTTRLSLTWSAATIQANIGALEAKNLDFGLEVTLSGNGTTYYLAFDLAGIPVWVTTNPDMHFTLPVINGGGSRILTENDFVVTDVFNNIPGFPIAGTLTVKIINDNSRSSVTLVVGGVYLNKIVENGYRDEVILSNNARGSLDVITLGYGDAPASLSNAALVITNLITNNAGGTPTSAWKTGRLTTAKPFVSLMALDYALEYALPRLRTKGRLNVPASAAAIPPFFLSPYDSLFYIVDTYEFDLYNDEVSVEMTTQPAVSLSITSETVRDLTNAEYSASQDATGTGSSAWGSGRTMSGVDLSFDERMGMVVQGNGSNQLHVILESTKEIPTTNLLVKNDGTSGGVRKIAVVNEYPQVEEPNTLYLLVED